MLKNLFYIGMAAMLLASCSNSPKEFTACECYDLIKSVKASEKKSVEWCKSKSSSDEAFQKEISVCAAKSMGFDADNMKVNTGTPQAPGAGTYNLDLSKSKIKWTGRKVTGSHTGNVSVKSGNFVMGADGTISGGSIIMDMNSITVTDIKDEKSNGDLVGHLKADDFFGVAAHPEASFNIKSSEMISSNSGIQTNFKVNGDLIIKGISKPATAMLVAVKSKNVEGNVSVAGAIKFDRTDYGIKYKSGKFFDSLGDKVINDEVTLQITLVAK